MKRLRLAFGVFAVLLCVGAALGSALTTGGHPPARPLHLSAKSGDPDAGSKKDTASVERGPAVATAAEEAYAQRAYPAAEVSLQATLDAQQAWSGVKQRSKGKNKAGQWTLMGPSSSNMPGLLVFSGADYTTSGLITALALDPLPDDVSARWQSVALPFRMRDVNVTRVRRLTYAPGGRRFELDVWHHRDTPADLRRSWQALEPQGFKVRPRALSLTLFVRLCLANVFWHGLGGGKYDEVTDDIIRKFFELAPPAFIVATET